MAADQIWGLWDCKVCIQRAISGKEDKCPNCNSTRPEGVQFYMGENPETAPAIADPVELERATAGADWYCLACEQANSNRDSVCSECGAARDAESPVQAVKHYGSAADVPRSGDLDAKPEAPQTGDNITYASTSTGVTGLLNPSMVKGLGIAIFVAILAFVGYMFLDTKEVDAVVTAHSWERSIDIEEYRLVEEGGWSVPTGGTETTHYQKQSGSRQVLDHYETKYRTECQQVQTGSRQECSYSDNGNGSFSRDCRSVPQYSSQCEQVSYQDPVYRQEPIYDTWYEYTIWKWVVVDTKHTSGENHDAAWPIIELVDGQREGNKSESYKLTVRTSDGDEHELEFDFDDWQGFNLDQIVIAHQNHFGQVLRIEPAK